MKKTITFIILATIAILWVNSAYAQINFDDYLELRCQDLGDCIKVLVNFVSTKVVPPIAGIFLMLSGFKFVTSSGNETKLKEAKAMFTWTIIGIAVTIGALALAYAFSNFLKGIS